MTAAARRTLRFSVRGSGCWVLILRSEFRVRVPRLTIRAILPSTYPTMPVLNASIARVPLALAALGNDADAEDIAQESLVLAFSRLDQFRGDASVRTWMVSIAWRLSMSRRRRVWWQVTRKASSDAELPALRAVSASPADRMQSAEFIRSVQQHIRRLPPKLRDALLLVAAGDLTQDGIAAALHIPAATFRGRVRDARLRLKTQLGQP